MNRLAQYVKIVNYLASKGIGQSMPKRYAASIDPNEEYDFEDMTITELEAYSSALSKLVDYPHEAMDTAQMYREMAFIDSMLKNSSFQKFAPYGIPKEKGGDSKVNDSKMEDCVNSLMKKGHDKESAIRICKNSLGFTKD